MTADIWRTQLRGARGQWYCAVKTRWMSRTEVSVKMMPVMRIWTGRDRAKLGLYWRMGSYGKLLLNAM